MESGQDQPYEMSLHDASIFWAQSQHYGRMEFLYTLQVDWTTVLDGTGIMAAKV